MTELHLAVIL